MATESIDDILDEVMPLGDFEPFAYHSSEADAINAHFEDVQDYSKRLNVYVTLFLAEDDDRIVGCRIKNVADIVENLPNTIEANHGGWILTVLFAHVWNSSTDEHEKQVVFELAQRVTQEDLTLQPCG